MVHIKIINDKYSNPHFALLQIVVFAGSIFESAHEKGITHFIEHLIFKGSKYNEGIKNLMNRLNSNGMSINAYTNNYNTVFHITTPIKFIKKAIDTLIKMVFNPLFRDVDIETERKVVINELLQRMNTPEKYASIVEYQKIFSENNPLHHPVIGYIETLNKLTMSDIQNYYDKYYNSANMLFLTIVNSNKSEKIRNIWKKSYSIYGKKNMNICSTKSLYDRLKESLCLINPAKKYVLNNVFPNNTSSYVRITWGLPTLTNKEFCAFQIFSYYLAGSMSSVLFNELREKSQLIYSISAFTYNYSNNYLMSIDFNCKKNTKNVNECIKKIMNVLRKFYKNGMTRHEFDKFKMKIITDYIYNEDKTDIEIEKYIRKYYMNLPDINYMKNYKNITNTFLKKTVLKNLKKSKNYMIVL
jgi:predicted Zn-dependent peptidase